MRLKDHFRKYSEIVLFIYSFLKGHSVNPESVKPAAVVEISAG